MSDVDPILNAWQASRDALTFACPDSADLATAALNGPQTLAGTRRAHLLKERCSRCEQLLLQTWQFEDPPTDVLLVPDAFSADAAFGAALRQHVEDCPSGPCREAAQRLEAGAPQSRPDGVAESTWSELRRRAAGWLVGPVQALTPLALARRSAAPGAPAKPRVFDDQISVTKLDASRIQVKLISEELRQAARVLVTLQDRHGDPLAAIVFDDPAGQPTEKVGVDAKAATRDSVTAVVALLSEPPTGPGAQP